MFLSFASWALLVERTVDRRSVACYKPYVNKGVVMDLSVVKGLLVTLPAEIQKLREDEATAALKREQAELFHAALEGLRTGWRQRRPGKDRLTWYFIRYSEPKGELGGRRISEPKKCWITELADDPEAMRLGHKRMYGDGHDLVPSATYDEIAKDLCTTCLREVPLIGTINQTIDSPDGDVWEETLGHLCLHCRRYRETSKRHLHT